MTQMNQPGFEILSAIFDAGTRGRTDTALDYENALKLEKLYKDRIENPMDAEIKRSAMMDAQWQMNNPDYYKWKNQGVMGEGMTRDAKGRGDQATWEIKAASDNSANVLSAFQNNKINMPYAENQAQEVQKILSGTDTQGAPGTIGFPTAQPQPSTWGGETRGKPTLRNVMTTLESGKIGDFGANGKILEGPPTKYGTAKGKNQVIDSTNAKPGYGVRPAQNNSVEERARVGYDYIEALAKHYGDDLKGLAAYNYGPGNFDAILKAHPTDWFDYLPAETKSYVARGAQMLTGQQSPAGFTPPAGPTAQASVQDRLNKVIGNTPTHWGQKDLAITKDADKTAALEAKYAIATDANASRERMAQNTIYGQQIDSSNKLIKDLVAVRSKMLTKEHEQVVMERLIAGNNGKPPTKAQIDAEMHANKREIESELEHARAARDRASKALDPGFKGTSEPAPSTPAPPANSTVIKFDNKGNKIQ